MVSETVEEIERGYRIEIKHKRGTGTRDQDTITAEAKTESLDELREERTELRSTVIEEMERLREHQPDGEVPE
jgi:hypothetical protein